MTIEIKKSSVPEFIDFTKNLITVNAALIGGVFFKTKKSIQEISEVEPLGFIDSITHAPATAFAAISFTISILFLFAFIAGLIEHKATPDSKVQNTEGALIDQTCNIDNRHVVIFSGAFIAFIIGLSLLCISLF